MCGDSMEDRGDGNDGGDGGGAGQSVMLPVIPSVGRAGKAHTLPEERTAILAPDGAVLEWTLVWTKAVWPP